SEAVHVTAERRTWMLRAGVVLATVLGGIGLTATAAIADPTPSFNITSVSQPGNVYVGGAAQNVRITLANHDAPNNEGPSATITVTLDPGDKGTYFKVTSTAGCMNPGAPTCTFHFTANQQTVNFQVAPAAGATVPPGTNKSFTADIEATSDDQPTPATDSASVNLQLVGQVLLSVSGKVIDQST